MPDTILDAALALHRAGRLDEAAAEYRKLLDLQPNDPDTLHLLGLVTAQSGRPEEGAKLIQRAITLRPHTAVFHANMGYALRLLGRHDIAVAAFRQAVALDPRSASAWFNLGLCLIQIGNLSPAAETFNRAIALWPNYAEAHNALGSILRPQKRIDDALDSFRRAIEIDPKYAEAHHNLALALADSGRIDDAVESESRAMELAPDVAACASGRIYLLHFHPRHDRASIHREMQSFNQRFAAPLADGITPHDINRDAHRRLKIGYVSPDFYHQAEAHFVLPLLQNHDHGNFEIHCYSSVTRPDEITAKLRHCADVWHDVAAETDEQLAHRIRADQVDILVDLTMHMRQNRILLFARKAAPIQVTWLAYPGGTGLTAIDYRLTDSHLDPTDCDQFYVEQSIRLPGCWCCYDPLSDTPISVRPSEGFIRFACLNNPVKLNDSTLLLWAQVLAKVPDSRLLLLVNSDDHRRRISRLFADAGVDAQRLEFTGYLPRPEYLALHNNIDVCLDPLPYNGITTTLDALWMGVPVVSPVGQTAPGRAGLSLLSSAGMDDLVAHTPDQFVEIASCGRTIPREEIRRKLRESPLMNAKQFAADVERAYRQMWHRFTTQSPA
jgi:predicted O-linked N-acetylglucosamine transferase (SPINDLY family)